MTQQASRDQSTFLKRDDFLVHTEALNSLYYSFFLNKDIIDITEWYFKVLLYYEIKL